MDIPINSGSIFNGNSILLGGGGGSSKSGIKNKLIMLDEKVVVRKELILEDEHDSIMSVHSVDDYIVFCANDSKTNIKENINNDLRVYKFINGEFEQQWKGQAIFKPPSEYVRVVRISPKKDYILCGTTEKTIVATKLDRYSILKGELPDEVYDIDFIDDTIAILTMPSQISIIDIKPEKIENLFILPLPTYSGSKASPNYRCAKTIAFNNKQKLLIATNLGRDQGYLSWFDIQKEEEITKEIPEEDKENARRKSIVKVKWGFKFLKTNCVSKQPIRNIAIRYFKFM
eukprot:NODE_63_length_26141_cov_1.022656.p11 type:complete len:287 gc:universal NODE_63_length_26141_cov_1.022656:17325-18185(+)